VLSWVKNWGMTDAPIEVSSSEDLKMKSLI